jgi:uncharacterized protein
MPLIKKSTYKPPFYLLGGTLQTLVPALFRKIEEVGYERERLTLSDGDFIDLDWIKTGQKRLVVLTHGLEGDSQRHYMRGMAKIFRDAQWDVLAWNCRSCSGEMNRALRMYNHGDTDDISELIEHVLKSGQYNEISMVGFSMGGSITLNYLGFKGNDTPKEIKSAVAFSAPCDMATSVKLLDKPSKFIYRNKFLTRLTRKMTAKAAQYPDKIDLEKLKTVKVWEDFDRWFSAPVNGYDSPQAFYRKASANFTMHQITVPTLVLSALNDPILTPECFPYHIAEKHPFVYLETPKRGGHVGFTTRGTSVAWSEVRALEFCGGKARLGK